MSQLQKGQIITQLEGVDLGGEEAVVVQVKTINDHDLVTLYFPELEEIKQYKVPSDAPVVTKPELDYTIPSSQIDELRLNSPGRDEKTIRQHLPDSYFPSDPNYPSTMTDVLWHPTVRWTPVPRFYRYQGQRKRRTMKRRHRRRQAELGQFDTGYPDASSHRPRRFNYPSYQWSDGAPVIPKPDPRIFDPAEVTQELVELATSFWQLYQQTRITLLPAQPGYGQTGLDVEQYAVIFQREYGLTTPEMDKLWRYMMGIKWVTNTAYLNWKDMLYRNELNQVRTPNYYKERKEARARPRRRRKQAAKATDFAPTFFIDVFLEALDAANGWIQRVDELKSDMATSEETIPNAMEMVTVLDNIAVQNGQIRDILIDALETFKGSKAARPAPEPEPEREEPELEEEEG